MADELSISVDWERIEEGSEEERVCFGLLNISHRNRSFTEGIDGFVERTRKGPLVSGYHLAQWIAWNWWRLVCEPKPPRPTPDWEFAHRLSTIGEGYIWPNITVFSDRARTAILAKPTQPQGFSPFRFTADLAAVIPTNQFEAAAEQFVGQIQGNLRAKSVPSTNLDQIWEELLRERADPETSNRRRLEALLGFDPDEGAAKTIDQLCSDAALLGEDAIQEIAADHKNHDVPTAAQFDELANTHGNDTILADHVQLTRPKIHPSHQQPAWIYGAETARALRDQERLGSCPLSNDKLAEMSAISATALEQSSDGAAFAFCIDDPQRRKGKVVLRSKWEAGRRFELARLIGDRLTSGLTERLLPATHAYTYRQKIQRAFAAEFLCPFEALLEKLKGDFFSADAREDAAHHFNVSDRTITTLLVNHKILDRDYLEDFEELAV